MFFKEKIFFVFLMSSSVQVYASDEGENFFAADEAGENEKGGKLNSKEAGSIRVLREQNSFFTLRRKKTGQIPKKRGLEGLPLLHLDLVFFPDLRVEKSDADDKGSLKSETTKKEELSMTADEQLPALSSTFAEFSNDFSKNDAYSFLEKDPANDEKKAVGDAPPLSEDFSLGGSDIQICVSAAERKRALYAARKEAFGASLIPLGPFFWASRDRTLVQAMLLYWRLLDVENDSKLTLLLPIFGSLCEADGSWFVGVLGLWGEHVDALGSAGYIGPYFYRRDKDKTTDVLFPFYWNLKKETRSSFVLLNAYRFVKNENENYGFAPFYFGGHRKDGSFYDITPAFAYWGTKNVKSFWFAQTYGSFSTQKWKITSPPFYFGEEKLNGEYYHHIPFALTFAWGKPSLERGDHGKILYERNLIVGPFYDFKSPLTENFGVFPFWLQGNDRGQKSLRAEYIKSSYFHLPLLLSFHWMQESSSYRENTWVIGQTYWHEKEDGWDVGSFPFYFAGHTDDSSWISKSFFRAKKIKLNASEMRSDESLYSSIKMDYHVLPPLLFAYFRQSDEHRLFMGQTFVSWSQSHRHIASFPFWFHERIYAGSDAVALRWYDHIPLALSFNWGTEREENHILGPAYLFSSAEQKDFGFLPFFAASAAKSSDYFLTWGFGHFRKKSSHWWWAAQTLINTDGDDWWAASLPFFFGGGDKEKELWVVPALGYLHFQDEERRRTHFLNNYLWRSKTGYDLGVAPIYFRGRSDAGFYYDVVASLAFARWGDVNEANLFFLQTYLFTEKDRSLVWSFPFYFAGEGTANDGKSAYAYQAIPLLGYASWSLDDESWSFLGPFFDAESEHGEDHGFAPFYFAGDAEKGTSPFTQVLRDFLLPDFLAEDWLPIKKHHYRLIPPLLYAHFGNDNVETTFFGPAAMRHSQAGWDATVLPPFYFGGATSKRSQKDFSYQVFPLLLSGHVQIDSARFTVVGPWYDFKLGNNQNKRYRGLLPFFVSGISKKDFFLFGLGFGAWGDEKESTFFALQTYVRTTPVEWTAGSLPFYAGHADLDAGKVLREEHWIPPLFIYWSRDKATGASMTVIGPWMQNSNAVGSDWAVFPFVLHSTTNQSGFSPLAKAWNIAVEENEGRFLLSASKEKSSFWLTPIGFSFSDNERTDFVWGPYYFFSNETEKESGKPAWKHTGLFPFYHQGRSSLKEHYDVIPALASAWWGNAKSSRGVFGPLLFSTTKRKDDISTAAFVFPFYLSVFSEDKDKDGIVYDDKWVSFIRHLPGGRFFGDENSPGQAHLIPLFLAGYAQNQESTRFILGPNYGFFDDNERHIGSLPFFAHGRMKDGQFYDVIPPLLFASFGIENEDSEEHSIWFAQTHWNSRRDHFKKESKLWSFPFYFSGEEQQVDGGEKLKSGYHLVPPLFSGVVFDEKEKKSFIAILPPAYISYENKDKKWTLMLSYFSSENKVSGDFSTMLVPFYFSGKNKEEEWKVFLPIYGAWHDAVSETEFLLTAFSHEEINGDFTHGILPFYYAQQRGKYFLRMATPFYWSWGTKNNSRTLFLPTLTYASRLADETFLLAPFVYHRANLVEGMTVVFPFYWHFFDADSDFKTMLGLWWDVIWANGERRVQVAPGYIHIEDRDEDFYIAGPVAWSKGKEGQPVSWSFHVFPFFGISSYHPGHLKWRALQFAFGYEREANREQFMIMGIKMDITSSKEKKNVKKNGVKK